MNTCNQLNKLRTICVNKWKKQKMITKNKNRKVERQI
jgi:hypothetical protein